MRKYVHPSEYLALHKTATRTTLCSVKTGHLASVKTWSASFVCLGGMGYKYVFVTLKIYYIFIYFAGLSLISSIRHGGQIGKT